MINITVLIEAFAVGIMLLLVSVPTISVMNLEYPIDFAQNKTKYYIAMIVVGIIVHLLCELSGLNKWYCKNGNACSKKMDPAITHPAGW